MTLRKLLVVGMDGATWDLLDPWIAAGHLPNLAGLRRSGLSGPLASTLPPLSAPAWASFLTGANQGKHGLYDFVRRKSGSYALQLTDSTSIRLPTLFEYLGEAGLRVASINVPMTYPAWPIQGVMIAGPFAPAVGPGIVEPTSWWPRLQRAVPQYEILPDYRPGLPRPEARLAQDLVAAAHNRTMAAEFVLAEETWDALFVVYTATDQAQHSFWHYLPRELAGYRGTPPPRRDPALDNPILDVYREIDRGIGRLLSQVEKEVLVLVLSDHGAGPLESWLHLNAWLAAQGWLRYERRPTSFLRRAQEMYSRHLPQPVRRAIRRLLGRRFSSLKEVMETSALLSSIDWSRTRAYALGSGDIFVNLRGREPHGIVEAGPEYEALRAQIIEDLGRLESPEGQRVVARVYRREELYHGPALDAAADLTVELADHRVHPVARLTQSASIFESPYGWWADSRPLTGGHRPEGMFILRDPSVSHPSTRDGTRLIDLAPTLLARLGLPVPALMDGRPILGNISAAPDTSSGPPLALERRANLDRRAYTEEEQQEIERRLRDLGYL
ncbi:MAG TPA: alkaline phosphatase family protein [Anaerolineales bacterium]|nr:alkaline phosphatase family protein [Anaerolineales bacterium]